MLRLNLQWLYFLFVNTKPCCVARAHTTHPLADLLCGPSKFPLYGPLERHSHLEGQRYQTRPPDSETAPWQTGNPFVQRHRALRDAPNRRCVDVDRQ